LQRLDHRHEVVEADDSFKLEAGAFVGGPDAIGLDAADHRQAHDDAIAAAEHRGAADHEAMGGDVADVQRHVAAGAVLADHRMVDRMPGRPALIGDRKLCSAHLSTFLRSTLRRRFTQQMLEKG
jgi:hypothetical protein